MANNTNQTPEGFVFNFSSEQKDPIRIDLIRREGDAARINEPVRFSKAVLLGSIGEWISKRAFPENVQDNPGVIMVSIDPDRSPGITFYENPNDELATVLTASIVENPDFKAFGINTGAGFYQKELEALVKRRAHCFESLQTARALLTSLRNFEVRYEQLVEKQDDRQGNKKDLQTEAIRFSKGEIPNEFKLRLPFYLGTPLQEITLEIEIDKGQNNQPKFSFHSLDLEIKKREVIESAIGAQLALFQEKFPVLYV